MAARRYWRFDYFGLGNFGDGRLAELRLRETPGGAFITPAVVTEKTGFNYGSVLQDGNNATTAGFSLTGGNYWRFDLGVGVAKDVVEIVATASSNTLGNTQAPFGFTVYSSSDDITYSREWLVLFGLPWSLSQTQTATRPSIGTGVARYWLLNVIETQANGTNVAMAEFALKNGGGNLLAGKATQYPNGVNAQGTSGSLVDGVTGSGGVQTAVGRHNMFRFDMGAGNEIACPATLEITSTNVPGETPKAFSLWRSDNGVGFEYIDEWFEPANWTNYLTRSYSIDQPVDPNAARARIIWFD